MAYRRKQGMSRSSTFQEETIFRSLADPRPQGISRSSTFQEDSIFRASPGDPFSSSSSSSLAAQAIRASAAHRDQSQAGLSNGNTLLTASGNEGGGLWGVVARKGKEILEDGNHISHLQYEAPNSSIRKEGQGGSTIAETSQDHMSSVRSPWQMQTTRPQTQTTSHEDQLKASRDVAMATAAKAKLLLRELKTVKADLAFAKQRCSQLEEENKILREAREKGDNPADDDMIRLQLETLLAEKARLAHENSVYARENLILREIVEYHQLTMQDVVYLDEGIEEVTEVSSIPAVSRMLSASPPLSPKSMHSPSRTSSLTKESALGSQDKTNLQHNEDSSTSNNSTSTSKGKDLSRK
ncbi:uncharacterized protein LOC107776964 [Nicotiana tabacum]|uniref:Uncharacterized protein LOC107776964 n=1 Tax=Nicotiana tabacum TaxID=4097 RepID=A0A1S3YJX8_TOBAC|nr:uncharacterized protein LOC104086874 [Nicotiana tomentosiformis]XP_016452410.1 PREDICTED: uncharacterized protein LOC107776964 [Nicotiana tabacum]